MKSKIVLVGVLFFAASPAFSGDSIRGSGGGGINKDFRDNIRIDFQRQRMLDSISCPMDKSPFYVQREADGSRTFVGRCSQGRFYIPADEGFGFHCQENQGYIVQEEVDGSYGDALKVCRNGYLVPR